MKFLRWPGCLQVFLAVLLAACDTAVTPIGTHGPTTVPGLIFSTSTAAPTVEPPTASEATATTAAQSFPLPTPFQSDQILPLPDAETQKTVANIMKKTMSEEAFSAAVLQQYNFTELALFPDPKDPKAAEVSVPVLQSYPKVDFTHGITVGLFWDRGGTADNGAKQVYVVSLFEDQKNPEASHAEFRNAAGKMVLMRPASFGNTNRGDTTTITRFAHSLCILCWALDDRDGCLLCW